MGLREAPGSCLECNELKHIISRGAVDGHCVGSRCGLSTSPLGLVLEGRMEVWGWHVHARPWALADTSKRRPSVPPRAPPSAAQSQNPPSTAQECPKNAPRSAKSNPKDAQKRPRPPLERSKWIFHLFGLRKSSHRTKKTMEFNFFHFQQLRRISMSAQKNEKRQNCNYDIKTSQ